MTDDLFDLLQAGIEKRVREQLFRHQSIESTIELSQVVDIQIDQEREKLEIKVDELYDEGKIKWAEITESIIEWLPELAKNLKRR